MAKILVVDDDQQVRTLVSRYLTAKQYEVVSAENGAAGIEAAKTEQPDLVLMDLNMPVMDGFKATKRIKEDPATQTLPVLILSAEIDTENRDSVYEAGCDGFVQKPINFDRLMTRIAEFL